jgi:hypothetical protein
MATSPETTKLIDHALSRSSKNKSSVKTRKEAVNAGKEIHAAAKGAKWVQRTVVTTKFLDYNGRYVPAAKGNSLNHLLEIEDWFNNRYPALLFFHQPVDFDDLTYTVSIALSLAGAD